MQRKLGSLFFAFSLLFGVGCRDKIDPCGTRAPSVTINHPGSHHVGDTVVLTATVSDVDADPAGCAIEQAYSYEWALSELPAGSEVELNNPRVANPSLVTDVSGTYAVSLVVTDASGLTSDRVILAFDVDTCGEAPPVATIDNPGAVNIHDIVQLGAQISDADNEDRCGLEQTFTYAWSLLGSPAGSVAELADPNLARPTLVPDTSGIYQLQLIVTDDRGLSSHRARFDLDVGSCGASPPVVAINELGGPFNVGDHIGFTAMVTDADDPCGVDPTRRYAWRLMAVPVGSNPLFANTETPTPTLVPDLPTLPGEIYQVELTVTDSNGLSGTDQLALSVTGSCGLNAPVITGLTGFPGVAFDWNELEATFTDGDIAPACGLEQTFTFLWELLDSPAGAMAVFDDASLATPGFWTETPGAYQVRVTISDSAGLSGHFEDTVTILDCGASPPVVAINELGGPFNVGDHIGFTAMVTDTDDPCGVDPTRRYAWRLLAVPVGSNPLFANTETPTPTLVPDLPTLPGEIYQVELTVTDSNGLSGTDQLALSVTGSCGLNAPVITGLTGFPGVAFDWNELEATFTDGDIAPACGLEQTFTFLWELLDSPAGAMAVFDDASLATPGFWTETPGAYQVRVTITDSAGLSGHFEDTVTISDCGASPPVVVINELGGPFNVGDHIGFTAMVTDADDPCGVDPTRRYAWRLLAVPVGSNPLFANTETPTPTLVPDLPTLPGEIYQVELTVTDSNGLSGTDQILLQVAGS